MKPKWEEKYEWRARWPSFLVTVECRYLPDSHRHGQDWKWNVYAYLYPKHPRFQRIVIPDEGSYRIPDGCNGLHFHGGILGAVTLFRPHYDKGGNVTSYQFGSDYDHLHDDWARETNPQAGPRTQIFKDAEILFSQLLAEEESAK